jgi:nucleotide-binding universal stress UspA family protein
MVPGISRLIVGTSGSPGSLRALRYGEFLARAHDALLMPVIAWEPHGGERAERIQPSGPLREECRHLACRRLRDALVAVWGKIPDDSMVDPCIERGPAGWLLVSLACQPGDVLLVGAGRRGAAGWMTFSKVTRYCLTHAQCPVLAVPPPELAREFTRGRLGRMLRHRPLTAEQVLGDQPSPPS